jgi:hypothetical protein
MATQNDTARFSALKARLAAINCELLEDDSDDANRYYVFDKVIGKLVSIGQDIETTYDVAASLITQRDVIDNTRKVEAARARLPLREDGRRLQQPARPRDLRTVPVIACHGRHERSPQRNGAAPDEGRRGRRRAHPRAVADLLTG